MIFQRKQYIDNWIAGRSNGLVNIIGCNKRLRLSMHQIHNK